MNLRISVIAAGVLCASVHGQTSATSSSAGENSLETAGRDLRALPATERSQELLGKSSGLGSAGLPALALPVDGAVTPPSKPEPNSPPSATWLQDALKQTEAERAQPKSQVDPALAREQSGGYKPAQVPDPFAQYLEQWLSPRDLELLRSDSKKTSDQKAKNPWEQPQAQPSSLAGRQDSPLSQPGSGTALIPIMPLTRNPYIDEPDVAPIVAAQTPLSAQVTAGQTQVERSRVPSPLPSATTTPLLPRQTGTATPTAVPAEAVSKPPTLPLVDDRKYFPQLHRF